MLISIITIVYNGATTIRSTLESVVNQNHSQIEHIIVDGGSTDETLAIVQEFPHISKLISEPDRGVYDAMNKGLSVATGDIIGILNADDLFATDNILAQIATFFKQDKTLDCLYGNIEFFNGTDIEKISRYWRSTPYYPTFFEDGEVPPHPSLYVRRQVYEKIGGYWPYFKISGDNEFMFRLLKVHNYKSYFFDTTIVKMRLGGISTRGAKSYLISTMELMSVWRINGYSYPKRLLLLRPYRKIKQLLFKNNFIIF